MGTKVLETYPARKQLAIVKPELSAEVSVTVKDGFKCSTGDVLGKITADDLYRRRSRTNADGVGFITTSTTGVVEDAGVFAPGDVLKNAAGTIIGTVAVGGVNTTTNQITLQANAAVAVADGAAVLGSDGSQLADVISDGNCDGDEDTTIPSYLTGLLDESQINGLDSSAKTELGGVSRAGLFIF